jgi:hypothetical protein
MSTQLQPASEASDNCPVCISPHSQRGRQQQPCQLSGACQLSRRGTTHRTPRPAMSKRLGRVR